MENVALFKCFLVCRKTSRCSLTAGLFAKDHSIYCVARAGSELGISVVGSQD